MRYSQIRTLYEKMVAAQAACSREWRISDTLVMCVEFDMYAAMSESHATRITATEMCVHNSAR